MSEEEAVARSLYAQDVTFRLTAVDWDALHPATRRAWINLARIRTSLARSRSRRAA